MSDRVDRMLNAAMARAINGDGLVRASNVVGKLCDRIEQLELALISERNKFTTAEAVWSSFTEKILAQLAAEKALADDYKAFIEKCDTTWNDAIEAAARWIRRNHHADMTANQLAAVLEDCLTKRN